MAFIEIHREEEPGRKALRGKSVSPGAEILNWIYPERCLLCRHLPRQRDEAFLKWGTCELCRKEDYRLSVNLEAGFSPESAHDPESGLPSSWKGHVSYRYEDRLRDALERLKYNGKKSYGACFGRWMYEEGKNEPALRDFLQGGAFIVPVPLAHGRRKERGYNQAELMAEVLADESGCRMEHLLVRVKETRAQKDLGEWMRAKNMRRAFEISPSWNCDRAAPSRIILVDDIYTTGATLAECALVLQRKWPNSEIIWWVFSTERY